jgi:hypothetical protein
VGGVALEGGSVNYTDNFIKPNYTAILTDIGGKIGGFGTASQDPAPVDLQGEINGSAPIAISGAINPLVPMAFVDIKANANGIELTGLTPYSTKYTGYPIEKGTLSVNVHYLLKDRQLTADNHFVIDQLTFGDRIENSTAINLPIRLAVSLLKDSQGRIDVSIPISGSLSDPQFSVGEVIWSAVKNMIVKAAAAPFKLLASLGGGGSANGSLSYIEFQPGLATLTPEDKEKLATLTKGLQERTSLRLEILGRADPTVDREGLRQAKLDQLLRREKFSDIAEKYQNVSYATVQITPDEYDKYLKEAYKEAKFEKPKNLLGLDKSLPPEEMRKLLLDHIDVTEADVKQRAQARANAVRQQLSKQIDPQRLFVVAPKLDATGITDNGKTTRVELNVS